MLGLKSAAKLQTRLICLIVLFVEVWLGKLVVEAEGPGAGPPGRRRMSRQLKLLFICSQNKIWSLTAEHMLQGVPGLAVKSAGTEARSRIRVNEGHIGWADFIFVMEKKHRRILEENFPVALLMKPITSLNIPNEYRYMEPALMDGLKAGLGQHIKLPESD
jgi:predicted protein tyrosine phosphatase